MKFHRILIMSAVLFGLVVAPTAAVSPLNWQGVTWDEPFGVIDLNQAGQLEVTTACNGSSNCWGAAHYNTPASLRNDPDHSVSVAFIDGGPGTTGIQIWIEKEGPPNGAWTQFGSRDGAANYFVYWWNTVTNQQGTVQLNVARTAGLHTLTIGKRANGTVDYFLDGDLVYSNAVMDIGYLGDVYLASHTNDPSTATAVFTAYSTDNDYVEPIPQSKLCINSYTRKVRMLTNCTGFETQVKLPSQAPLTLCAPYNGLARVPWYGGCGAGERTIVALGDQSIPACVNAMTKFVRLPYGPGQCTGIELETLI